MSTHLGADLLPAVETLTAEQRRGAACVWCETTLQPGIDDVDLGARPATRTGSAWFPRACPDCAHVHAAPGTEGSAPEPRLGGYC
ncbi:MULTISPECIES: hypothetical protein [unclassified Streptomyces]|uniref:hypothetical protein n=1 Tax=unclassified Streptomyces TaxID=2593676 RepID=UPI00081ECB53|nr:hypothetical protein [Streptomyces sp. LcepLS]MYR25014.1 hypothetical protein [Streptomyces sp. SID4945]SCE72121.1 hypothetical protein GA0115257_101543 [Streptomyces sp. LcepLS]